MKGKLILLIILIIIVGIVVVVFGNQEVKDYGMFKITYSKESQKYEKEISNAAHKWSEYIDSENEIKIKISLVNAETGVVAYANSDIKRDKVVGGNIFIAYKNLPYFFNSRVNVIMHEMGHVLGIGTHPKWKVDNYELQTDELQNTLKSFNELQTRLGCKSNFNKIPLETKSGAGSAKSHWDTGDRTNYEDSNDKCIGLKNEVMRYKMDGGKYYISELTTSYLKDLGFKIKKFDNYENNRYYFDGYFQTKEYKCGTCM